MSTQLHTDENSTVLVLNSGSSSLKYQLVDPVSGEAIASGIIERIGSDNGLITHKVSGKKIARSHPMKDHSQALEFVLELFAEVGPDLNESNVVGVGHRIVQGGALFSKPTLIDDAVVQGIEDLIPLAPLHNKGHVQGIRVARELLPDVPHVAIFDTAFFQTLPEAAYTYGLNQEVARKHAIRRYGFHGTSHQYVAQETANVLGRDLASLNTIVLHLGNGASVSAVRGGQAVETSMGFTPLEGLVMGTRTGDIDPAVVFYLNDTVKMSIAEIDDLFNKESGIKGFTGQNDFRELHDQIAKGNANAALALDVYIHRLRKYVGAYIAVLGRVDAIVFTAGVGENDHIVRERVVENLEGLGIAIDVEANAIRNPDARIISTDWAPTKVLIVPTNEELSIARQVVDTIS